MIKFDKFTLKNGLKVIVHKDKSTPIVAINILYNVGSRDENPNKTGFAHLFEHLMFGGSKNIPVYDKPLQLVGGENNAFTNTNITNYYLTLPKDNIETGFWLESDRMKNLNFSEKSLNVQRSVVIEEYKQRYLNQPYGDVWLMLRPLAYKKHPYRWATIGKDISHIENANLDDVKNFFNKYYAPNNAILTVAGDVETEQIKKYAEKWFGSIEKRNVPVRNLPAEPEQTEKREKSIKKEVPFNAIYKAYHMCSRNDKNYHATDLLSDILANGKSSRLYQSLVKKQKIFSNIDAYITGDIDNGLFIITGQLIKGTDMDVADKSIEKELELIKTNHISEYELTKVKNKVETILELSEMSVLNKAMNLSFHELLGDAENINLESKKYSDVNPKQINDIANNIFKESNCSTLFYNAIKQ
ncbi:MAG: insulinase family protein [Bacteroidetes bacterium]|nr:MAG: insulinase family protein [Bacteroidota bacterium]